MLAVLIKYWCMTPVGAWVDSFFCDNANYECGFEMGMSR